MSCRSCAAPELVPVLDLGCTPLANALLARVDLPEPTYPLALVFCPACTLVQLTYAVAPETLFRDYPYFSSVSDAYVAHARALAARMLSRRPRRVVDVGSNDGYLLQHYMAAGIPVLGIEPARNVAAVARARGIPTLNAFFGRELARELEPADVVHANNVLAHVADLDGFVAGLATLLAPGGLLVVEVPYVRELVDLGAFDTIYHEHLCYFSLTALARLAARHGLAVVDVERLAVHGGSLRVFLAHGGPATPAVGALLAEEAAWVGQAWYYQALGAKVERLRAELAAVLRGFGGARLAGYGASAKGSTLLNCFGIRDLAYVVDRSPAKQGLFTPGTHLPIVAPERLREDPVAALLLLTWNFAEEILAQQAAFRARGGKFIIPLPRPRVV